MWAENLGKAFSYLLIVFAQQSFQRWSEAGCLKLVVQWWSIQTCWLDRSWIKINLCSWIADWPCLNQSLKTSIICISMHVIGSEGVGRIETIHIFSLVPSSRELHIRNKFPLGLPFPCCHQLQWYREYLLLFVAQWCPTLCNPTAAARQVSCPSPSPGVCSKSCLDSCQLSQ